MAQIGKGSEYLKSIPSILKIIEFVVLVIAIGTVGYFLNRADALRGEFFGVYGKKGNLEFFIAATVISWLIVMALFSLFITGLHEKVTAIPWPLAVVIISALCAILLLISSALVADTAKTYDGKTFGIIRLSTSLCKALDDGDFDPQCGHLIGGAVCGFIAMVLFVVDTAIHLRMFLARSAAPPATTAPVSS